MLYNVFFFVLYSPVFNPIFFHKKSFNFRNNFCRFISYLKMLTKSFFSFLLIFFLHKYVIETKSIRALPKHKLADLNNYPEQIHLAYGATPSQMIVTWVTLDYVNVSAVEYGINNIKNVAVGTSEIFVDGGSEHRQLNIHRVILTNLLPNQTYSKL